MQSPCLVFSITASGRVAGKRSRCATLADGMASCEPMPYGCRVSEYDPLIRRAEPAESDDLELVRRHFDAARRPYLASPVPWLVWAIVLPAAALTTPIAASLDAEGGVLFLWSVAVLVGGVVEGGFILRRRGRATRLGGWVMQLQGNQSLVGLLLSLFLIWRNLALVLPALWLLLIGHSFFLLGGLAFRPMRWAGIFYQLGGAIALWPAARPLLVFAVTSAIGNLTIAAGLLREAREARAGGRGS